MALKEKQWYCILCILSLKVLLVNRLKGSEESKYGLLAKPDRKVDGIKSKSFILNVGWETRCLTTVNFGFAACTAGRSLAFL